MKKQITSLILALILALSLTTPALAASNAEKFNVYGPDYKDITTANFIDHKSNGRLLLSLSSGPPVTAELLDNLDFVCNIIGAINIGPFSLSSYIPGCDYIDLGGKFNKYVDKTMKLNVRLLDAVSGDFVWEGIMRDGDIIFLGNDHPSGYRIQCKAYGASLPWVKLQVLENLDIS